jgi:hypothetical protein
MMTTSKVLAFLRQALLSALLGAGLIFFVFCPPARAQSQATTAGPRTVGDGTAFVYTPGKSESYGTTSGDIGGGDFGQPLFSRHQRWGQNTGIGSSGLQTQQATSAASPELVQRSPNGGRSSALARPDLSRGFLAEPSSPALSPASGGIGSFSRSPWQSPGQGFSDGLFSGNGLTSSYSTYGGVRSGALAPSTGIYQDDQAMPSFLGGRGGSYLPLSGAGDQIIFKGIEPRF